MLPGMIYERLGCYLYSQVVGDCIYGCWNLEFKYGGTAKTFAFNVVSCCVSGSVRLTRYRQGLQRKTQTILRKFHLRTTSYLISRSEPETSSL